VSADECERVLAGGCRRRDKGPEPWECGISRSSALASREAGDTKLLQTVEEDSDGLMVWKLSLSTDRHDQRAVLDTQRREGFVHRRTPAGY